MNIFDFISLNYTSIFSLLFVFVFLFNNKYMDKKEKNLFYVLITLGVIEILLYNLEIVTSHFSKPTYFRILLSALGYSIRPFLIYIFILINTRSNETKKIKIFLIVLYSINILIAFSAFFTDIAFSYNENNCFVRGPLGYTSHITILISIICMLIIVIKRREKNKLESIVISFIALFIVASIILEALCPVNNIGRSSISLSLIFYYMFFQINSYRKNIDYDKSVQQELEKKSKVDSLTGFYNKEAFIEIVDSEYMLSSGESYALLFIDLDHFKNVNDTYGHLAGDMTIKGISDILDSFFNNCVFCRFGGDEFCVFINDINKQNLNINLNKLIKEIRKDFFSDNKNIKTTVSIGAVFSKKGETFDSKILLEIADKALYEAKNKGRNCYQIINI